MSEMYKFSAWSEIVKVSWMVRVVRVTIIGSIYKKLSYRKQIARQQRTQRTVNFQRGSFSRGTKHMGHLWWRPLPETQISVWHSFSQEENTYDTLGTRSI